MVWMFLTIFLFSAQTRAAVVEYDLTVAEQEVNITGKAATAMTINADIPGPTLRFKEGDLARIHVHNEMHVDTSIHWHGVLVPNRMDGVPFLTFPPIKAGTTFTYEFPIRQSGTYWYHSHTYLQEQRGVYGPIVIEPVRRRIHSDSDYVVLFSDWTNENPHQVMRTLRRGSEWYSIQKSSSQSLFGAVRLGMLDDYLERELQRMPPMDISDVAYDRFLANGKPAIHLPAHPGEMMRLRVINGSSTTYFLLEFSGGSMTIVSADGQDVEPAATNRLLIAVAETYDVLIHIPENGAYEFRATAHDASAYASVWIGSGKRRPALDVPAPDLYHSMGEPTFHKVFALTPAGAMGMGDSDVKAGKFDQLKMNMGTMQKMEHSISGSGGKQSSNKGTEQSGMNKVAQGSEMPGDHSMQTHEREQNEGSRAGWNPYNGKKHTSDFHLLGPDISSTKSLAVDGLDPRRPAAPYDKLRAVKNTAFAKDRTVRRLRLTLDGDMERYVWFINNKPLSPDDTIRIRKGEVVRFIMINRTMMHHPMHLHGHFFRVINGQGDYAPLKHTVDVAPMATTVIEFDADETGDWFFHCHLLYHLNSGMARVVHYQDFTPYPALAAVRPKLYEEPWYFWGQVDAMNNMVQGFARAADLRHTIDATWKSGWQRVEEPSWEMTAAWSYFINRFASVFAGVDIEGTEDVVERYPGVFGFSYLLPLNIEYANWVDTNGDFRFIAGKSLSLTPRLTAFSEAEYDTRTLWEYRAGLTYLLNKSFSLIGQYHSDYGPGAGLRFRF